MKLYTYHTSSASYRVRMALEWKELPREDVFVDIARGEQFDAAFIDENPNARVPFLVDGDVRIGQALAILEYLEEAYPARPLLPADPGDRARVRELCLLVIADTQPLQNLSPMQFLADPLGVDRQGTARWYLHWVSRGLAAFEARLAQHARPGPFCLGEAPTLADVCVMPQLVNWTRKGGGSLDDWPRLARVFEACAADPAFQRADPVRQPDAPPEAR